MSAQKTIRREISAEGIGLHSGHSIQIGLSPAGPDTGIIFRGEDGTLIPANTAHVVDGSYATTLGAYGVKIRTVEHLMAAASALGVDNLIVDVRGDELPAMDGSARPFVDLLLEAGITSLPAPRRPIVVERPIRVEQGTRFLQVLPADGLRISYALDHDHPASGLQVVSLSMTAEAKPGTTEQRPLGIPAVRDRTVEAALRHVLEPIRERFRREQLRVSAWAWVSGSGGTRGRAAEPGPRLVRGQ